VNFLAHCLIAAEAAAGRREAERAMLVAGGFLGDFLKGPVPEHLPAELAEGVRLHRRIDAYSNADPAMRKSSRRFPPDLRRLAPALVDVIADHLLALRWEQHHASPLTSFSRETYRQIHESREHLPAEGRRFLSWMVESDLLASYVSWETTLRGLRSITRRLGREELNPLIAAELPGLLDDLSQDFEEYFPDMLTHATQWLAARSE